MEVFTPEDSNRDPVRGRTAGMYPLIEGAFRHSSADPLPCQPDIQPLISVKVSNLPIAGEVSVSVARSGGASDYSGNLGEPSFEFVSNRHGSLNEVALG